MIRDFLLTCFLKIYLNIILLTCTWRVHNLVYLKDAIASSRPVMLCCWHERLVYLACFFKHWESPISVISSKHRDSQILGSILKSWDFHLIKGSSSRGWFVVVKKLIMLFKNSRSIVAITNDGPLGPPKQAKEGTLRLALKHNVSMVGMSGSSSKSWTLNTWDRLKLPKPFSIIYISFYEKYTGNKNVAVFSQYLNDNQNKIDKAAHDAL